MILLHAVPINWEKISGIRACVPELVAAQNRLPGVRAAMVVTTSEPGDPPELGFPVFDSGALAPAADGINLPAPFHRPDLVVFHSTYIPAHGKIARQLGRLGIPYIICPHGGMSADAMRQKWLKKKIGNLLFFNALVANGRAVHYLSQGERDASGGWNRPAFVLNNGVRLPPRSELAQPSPSAGLRLLFIGRLRIDHKGLDLLLDACGLLHAKLLEAGAHLDLRGPDHEGHTRILAERIDRLGLHDVVTLAGPVIGEAKNDLLKRADVFLHTSRWEGHPVAVLEALAYGVPCLLTPGTHMAEEVAAAGAGWMVQPTSGAIARGLDEILALQESSLQEAGVKARELAAGRYTWERIASCSVQAYRRFAA